MVRTVLFLASGLLIASGSPKAAKLVALGVTGALVLAMLLAPVPAHGQFGTVLGGLAVRKRHRNRNRGRVR